MIGLEHYLSVAAALFVIGIFGLFLNRKNVIILLMSIELMLLAVNINLVAFSVYQGNIVGQVFAMLVLAPLFSIPAYALAWGVLLAGILQFCVMWPALARFGVKPAFRLERT